MAEAIEIGHCVVCVDQNADNREMFALLLPACQVHGTSCGTEALRLGHLHRVDLYIMEQHLHDMTGLDLCRSIRSTDADTPILFYSTYGQLKSVALEAGASSFLEKGCDPAALIRATLELCDAGAARRGVRTAAIAPGILRPCMCRRTTLRRRTSGRKV